MNFSNSIVRVKMLDIELNRLLKKVKIRCVKP